MSSHGGRSQQPAPVVLLVDTLANNGALHIMLNVARSWAGTGTQLVVIQHLAHHAELAVPQDVPLLHLTRQRQRLRWSLPAVVTKLVLAARHKRAIVSGSEIGVGVGLGFVVAKVTRKKFVLSVHANVDDALAEWIPQRWRCFFYYIYRHADALICVAPGLVGPLVRKGVPRSRIRVVRNGIDIAAVRNAADIGESLVPPGHKVVVATGRLAPQKGYDILFRAHALIVDAHPHDVLILNDGPEEDSLRTLAEDLGVSNSIYFAGQVADPLVSVARADVFCLPSRHEGLPLSLLEALSLGVPCVATDSSDGVRTTLDDGRVGDLVPVNDVAALAAALSRHLVDPGRLRAKAELGRAHSLQFDSSAMVDGWAAAIHRAVD